MDYFNPPPLLRRDALLMGCPLRIGCGNVYTKKEDANFIVEKFLCIVNIIIPFFNKYTILGIKASDLKDFKK